MFIRQSAAAGAVLGFPAVLRAVSPNSNVQIVAVGLGGRGSGDARAFSNHPRAKIVGLCDVDTETFAPVDALLPAPAPHFGDFRAMFDQLGDRFDAVTIATPDHMHALVAIEAMRRGKHVYCQKPLSHTVWESRQMRLWAEKTNVITQLGNQNHSALAYRLATRLIREGAIGKVREIHSWVRYTGNEHTSLIEPPPPQPVPSYLDWDRWVGCAPMCPYTDAYHPFTWRDWQAFGGGALGDWGCHILDPVFTSLGLTAPLSVVSENSGLNRHVWPTREKVRYVFPGNALTAAATLPLTWSDGGLRPDRKLAKLPGNLDLPGSGSLFIGEKGNMVLGHVSAPRLYPLEDFKDFRYPKDVEGFNHWRIWVDAILAGRKTSGGFEYGGPLTEAALLGNVAAHFAGRPSNRRLSAERQPEGPALLQWDAAKCRFTNHEKANALVTKIYRSGWQVPAA